MDPAFLAIQLGNGVALAMLLFLIASGLTLVFGVAGVLNFAHGSLYMLGAYAAFTVGALVPTRGGFWAGLLVAPLVVGMLGFVLERLFLRRTYGRAPVTQLLLTFSLILVLDDLVQILWGADLKSIRTPAMLAGSLKLGRVTFPYYSLFLIAIGPVVAFVMYVLLYRTRAGKILRAAAEDRDTASTLGINVSRLFAIVFLCGSALAGLGGALSGPVRAITPSMGVEIIIEAFAVVVIGGLGSLSGAFWGSLIIGIVNAAGVMLIPEFAMVFVYLLMGVVLIVRPQGLLGAAG
jgi:branched-subunit amino acid ABC-type transport system permease component